MSKVLIVLSSTRPGRLADKILAEIQRQLPDYKNLRTTVADFRDMPLPFFDGPTAPAAPGFEPADKNVRKWTKEVRDADALLVVSAEYNHSYTAVFKNAIDWLAPQALENKPVHFIGYGWSGGAKAIEKTRLLLTEFLKAKPSEAEANLRFNQEIDPEGKILDQKSVAAAIRGVLDTIS